MKSFGNRSRLRLTCSLRRRVPNAVRADKVLRDEAIRKACLEFGYRMAATAREAGIHYSTVSKIIKGER